MKTIILQLIFLLGITTRIFAQIEGFELKQVRNTDNSIDLIANKKIPGTLYLKIEFTQVKNTFVGNGTFCLKSNFENVLHIRPELASKPIFINYKYSIFRGELKPKVNEKFQYLLPFKNEQKVRIIRTRNMQEKYFGNKSVENYHTFRVILKEPDTVYAMRKGIVVNLIDKFERNIDTTVSYSSRENTVRIEHEDGTYGEYRGFQKNSFKVTLGDVVYPNTPLGIVELVEPNKCRFTFDISYISNIENLSETSYTKAKSIYDNVNPYFITTDGVIQLEDKKQYTTLISEEAITKEMSKSDIKKRLKKLKSK
jgi:hypothetical protein